ncbi:MAG: VanZ family protein [Rhodothermales bacterium]
MIWKRTAALAWTLLIIILCSLPGASLPDVNIFSADKLGHFGMFAVLSWLWMFSTKMPFEARSWRVIVLGLALAGLTEVYQGLFVPGREPEVLDVLANAAGLLAGVWAFRVLKDRKK